MDVNLDDIKGKDAEGIGFWIVEKAMSIKAVKVDKKSFLSEALGSKLPPEQLQEVLTKGTCRSNISVDIIKEAAELCINNTKRLSNGESALTGLPGGIAGITAGIAADIIQFYANLIILIQKLLYLYGIDSIYDDIKDNNKDLSAFILCFIGIASGAKGIDDIVKILSKGIEGVYIKQGQKFILLAKPTFYSIAKKVAKSIGLSITKKGFAKAAAKAVPVVSSAISLLLNNATFSPMAKRLNEKLIQIYKSQSRNKYEDSICPVYEDSICPVDVFICYKEKSI